MNFLERCFGRGSWLKRFTQGSFCLFIYIPSAAPSPSPWNGFIKTDWGENNAVDNNRLSYVRLGKTLLQSVGCPSDSSLCLTKTFQFQDVLFTNFWALNWEKDVLFRKMCFLFQWVQSCLLPSLPLDLVYTLSHWGIWSICTWVLFMVTKMDSIRATPLVKDTFLCALYTF